MKKIFIFLITVAIVFCNGKTAFSNDIFTSIRLVDHDEIIKIIKDPYRLNSRERHNHDTPLIYAAKLGRYDIVDILLQYGANPSLADKNGLNFLMVAISKTYMQLEKFKNYALNCNINHVDKQGRSILHYAASNNLIDVELLLYILEIFPYINYQDNNGNTALFYAIDKKNLNVAKILLVLGADKSLINESEKYKEVINKINHITIEEKKDLNKIDEFKLKNKIVYDKITKKDLSQPKYIAEISVSNEKKENIFNKIINNFKSKIDFSSTSENREYSVPYTFNKRHENYYEPSISDYFKELYRTLKFRINNFLYSNDDLKQEDMRYEFAGPQLAECNPAIISNSDVKEINKVYLKGKILLQRIDQEKFTFIFLTSSGKRYWIRNQDKQIYNRLRYAYAIGKPVFISANALFLKDKTTVLDIFGCAIVKDNDEADSLTNRLKNEIFFDSPIFTLADFLLKASEQVVLDSIKKDVNKYNNVNKQLDEWIKIEFENILKDELDLAPNDMNPELAKSYYTAKIKLERSEDIVRNYVSIPDRSREIINPYGKVNIVITDEKIIINGIIHNEGTSTFRGTALRNSKYDSWIPFYNQGNNDFYVLFTNDNIYIVYEGTPKTQGCPVYSRFYGKF